MRVVVHPESNGEGTPRADLLEAVLPIFRAVVLMMYYRSYGLAVGIIAVLTGALLALWLFSITILHALSGQNPYRMLPIYLVSFVVSILILSGAWYVWRQFQHTRRDWLHFGVALAELDTYVDMQKDFTAAVQQEPS